MRRFYSPGKTFFGLTVGLTAEETRHLRNVLRLELGDEVSVFDGQGREFRATVSEIGKKTAAVYVIEEIAPASPESELEITLAAAILNGEKYDLVIQKAVELGVGILIPLNTIRCDVKVADAEKRVARWRRIALEATKQSGRAKLMHVAEPMRFEELIRARRNDNFILFSERDGAEFCSISLTNKVTALVGPKGGWEDPELELAAKHKVRIITLGGRTLRAETAAIVVAAILQHRFGDLN